MGHSCLERKQDRTWTCCNTFSYPSCNSRPWLLEWHISWQLVRSKWTNYVASKFSRPHPTRLLSLGFCEEWCVFTATHGHWRSQRKDLHSFSKSYTSDVTSHMGCNIFTIWTVSSTQWWSCWGLIWTKLPCFKNAYTKYWTINSYSSPFMMYSFCVFPNGSPCIY